MIDNRLANNKIPQLGDCAGHDRMAAAVATRPPQVAPKSPGDLLECRRNGAWEHFDGDEMSISDFSLES